MGRPKRQQGVARLTPRALAHEHPQRYLIFGRPATLQSTVAYDDDDDDRRRADGEDWARRRRR
jgi:hypothetical protein